jgi:hypothetical protein
VKRSCLMMMGVLGSEAELGREVNERFGLTKDARYGWDLDVCECRGKLAKRAGWER